MICEVLVSIFVFSTVTNYCPDLITNAQQEDQGFLFHVQKEKKDCFCKYLQNWQFQLKAASFNVSTLHNQIFLLKFHEILKKNLPINYF